MTFVKAYADDRYAVVNIESAFFKTILRHFFGVLERVYPGGWRLVSYVRCADKCLCVTNMRRLDVVDF